jgi:hypothetical protein
MHVFFAYALLLLQINLKMKKKQPWAACELNFWNKLGVCTPRSSKMVPEPSSNNARTPSQKNNFYASTGLSCKV